MVLEQHFYSDILYVFFFFFVSLQRFQLRNLVVVSIEPFRVCACLMSAAMRTMVAMRALST